MACPPPIVQYETSFEVCRIIEDVNMNGTFSLTWSSSNCVLMRCSETVHTFSLVINKELCGPDVFVIRSDSCTPPLSTMESSSSNPPLLMLSESLNNLSDEEKQDLILDARLCEDSYLPTKELKQCKQAVLSSDQSAKLCMATLTFDHKVVFYTQENLLWKQVWELNSSLKNQFLSVHGGPFTLGDGVSLDEYRKWIQEFSTTAIAWSSDLTDHRSSVDQSNYHLFFTGMADGKILVWKQNSMVDFELMTKLSPEHQNDQWKSEVNCMAWWRTGQNSGILATGHLDGCICMSRISVSNQEVLTQQIFMDDWMDGLRVDYLQWTQIKQPHQTLLVASKPYHLILYTLDNGQIERTSVLEVPSSQPVTALSVCQGVGIVASPNDEIFILNFKGNKGEVTMSVCPHLTTLNPSVFWRCLGCAVSPNAVFILSAHRPLQRLIKKEYREKYPRILLTPLHEVSLKSLLSLLQSQVSRDHQDILIFQRMVISHLLTTGQSVLDAVQEIQNQLQNREECWALQVLRDLCLFVRAQLHTVGLHLEEEFDLDKLCKDVTQRLIQKQMKKWIPHLDQLSPALGAAILGSIQAWSNGTDHSLDIGTDNRLTSTQWPQCPVCEENLSHFDGLYGQCPKQCIKTALCCVSLLPVDGQSLQSCLSCGHPAVSRTILADVPGDLKSTCLLCGGRVHDSGV